MKIIPEAFLNKFVRKEFKERFAHEWKKKPGKLNTRICHSADDIFKQQYKFAHGKYDYSRSLFADDEIVYVLRTAWIDELSYREVKDDLEQGLGILVISVDGSKFCRD